MTIKILIRPGSKTSASLRFSQASAAPTIAAVQVVSRSSSALGWNRLYATLLAQAIHDGRSDGGAHAWARETLSALSQVEGLHPDAIHLEDLRARLASPDFGGIVLADGLETGPIMAMWEARGQELGDPYSPIDDPDPAIAEGYFEVQADDRAVGWWSPVQNEALPVGTSGGPGRIEALRPEALLGSFEPVLTNLNAVGISPGHRLVYLGDSRLLDWAPAAEGSQYRVWKFQRFGSLGDPFEEAIPGPLSWNTINEGHELIWLGRDLYVDPTSLDLVLDWVPDTGAYRLYRVDLEGTKSDGETPDILPEPPLTSGTWSTIRTGKQLLYLGKNRVLEWESSSGSYRIWSLNRDVVAGADPLAALTAEGTWASLGEGSQLLNLGGDRVLAWCPANGAYELRRYDRALAVDPLLAPPLLEGHWQDRGTDRALLWLGGKDVLDWRPSDGQYLLRAFARGTAAVDPLPQSSPPPPDDPPALP